VSRQRLTRCPARWLVARQGRTRTRFSAYAAGAFEQLAQEAPAWLPRDAPLRVLAADFARYPSLPPPRREVLVAEAAAVVARALDGWAASAPPSARAAAGPAAANGVRMLDTGGQRSEAWFQKRDALLTASSFGNILGFWGEDRLHQIWVRPQSNLAHGVALLSPCACGDADP
jgi:hypothetical protein